MAFRLSRIDTDGDGYAGEFRMCDGDTVWTTGDGIPDFAGDAPPPAPVVRVTPLQNALRVQWNGYGAETFREPLFGVQDFEGFSVYLSTIVDGAPGTFSKVASFDVEDFWKYVWDTGMSDWRLDKKRFMLNDLLCLYAPHGCDDVHLASAAISEASAVCLECRLRLGVLFRTNRNECLASSESRHRS